MTMRHQKAVWVMASHSRWKKEEISFKDLEQEDLVEKPSLQHLWMWVLMNACLAGELTEETRRWWLPV